MNPIDMWKSAAYSDDAAKYKPERTAEEALKIEVEAIEMVRAILVNSVMPRVQVWLMDNYDELKFEAGRRGRSPAQLIAIMLDDTLDVYGDMSDALLDQLNEDARREDEDLEVPESAVGFPDEGGYRELDRPYRELI